ncbi:MAG TPA: heme lyase CcmF/NrfE family subunit [Longimicrobiales bacterium]|nr:heme lyase CcmF/NrfE family subunit [Longimicrobiales bacterium]
MLGAFGYIAIVAGLCAALAGGGAAFRSARTQSAVWLRRADGLALGMLGAVVLAAAAMVSALVSHDFSVEYVAQVGSTKTPLLYTIISLWSALEGSILLWAVLQAVYTVAFIVWRRRRGPVAADPWSLAILFGINAFFLLLIAWPANPFERVSPVPADGPGPNALLQNNPFMAVHPPLLYLGYVGMSVPFSHAMGALVAGTFDREWTRSIRRWTLVPWGFLSLGIVAGMWWSYETLGWGGYWAWDPVENASFLPWLTGTAFLHSMMVQERRGMLKSWNIVLIASTFLLTILGTFLTRSGVIQSVHAFTASLIGPFFLGFFTVALIGSVVLISWRSELLAGEGNLDSPLSRETAFLMNNLLFTVFTFTVLLGTLFPLLAEAVRGVKVSVGAPFFNRMTLPVVLSLVFLVGVGPALPWGRVTRADFGLKLLRAGIAAGVTGAVLLATGMDRLLAVLTIALAVFGAVLLAGEVLEPVRSRRARGEAALAALGNVMRANRRRYGGYIVHFGVLIIAVGIAVSSAYKHEGEWTLRPGQSADFRGYTLRLDSIWAQEEPQRDAVVVGIAVARGATELTSMFPRLNYYPNSMEPIATPAVREGAKEDLYLVLAAFDEDGEHATLRAIVSPLVTWIWAGALVLAAGVIFAWWPGQKRASVKEPVRTPPLKRKAKARRA